MHFTNHKIPSGLHGSRSSGEFSVSAVDTKGHGSSARRFLTLTDNCLHPLLFNIWNVERALLPPLTDRGVARREPDLSSKVKAHGLGLATNESFSTKVRVRVEMWSDSEVTLLSGRTCFFEPRESFHLVCFSPTLQQRELGVLWRSLALARETKYVTNMVHT